MHQFPVQKKILSVKHKPEITEGNKKSTGKLLSENKIKSIKHEVDRRHRKFKVKYGEKTTIVKNKM